MRAARRRAVRVSLFVTRFGMIRRLALGAALVAPLACAPALADVRVTQSAFDFGERTGGADIEHEYRIRNTGAVAVRIRQVALTPPLRVTRMPARIAAGDEAPIVVRMDGNAIEGRVDARIVVVLDDPQTPQVEFRWFGRLVPTIEVETPGAFYLAGQRGEAAEASVTIVNHGDEPLTLATPEHPTDRFTSRLATLDEGRRYRVTIALLPDGPAGRHAGEMTLRTSIPARPLLRIPVNTYLRERVYTFPDAVDLGNLRLADIRTDPGLLERTAQTLMVYRKGSDDFRVDIATDVPGLVVSAERGPRKDRYQFTLRLDPRHALAARAIRGTVTITTNDPQFPRVDVPVTGGIIDG
jgi:hypothetical protein